MAARKKKSSRKKTGSRRGVSSGVDSEVLDALGELDDDGWSDTEETVFEEVPDGRYQVRVDAAVLNRSKQSSRLQCSWTLTVVSGQYKNRKLFSHDGLDTEQSRGWFRGTLAKLGLEWPASASELPTYLQDNVVGSFAQVTVRTKGEFKNVYFDKALDRDDIDESDVEASDTEFDPDKYEDTGDDGDSAEDDGGESGGSFAEDGDVGSRVYVDEFGPEELGTVTAYDEDAETADIDFDDDTSGTYPWAEIHMADDAGDADDGDDGDEDDPEPEKGAAVTGKFEDGEWYPGTVKSVNRSKRTIIVKFEDGDEATYDWDSSDWKPTDDGDAGDDDGDSDGDGDSEPADGVEITFGADDLTATHARATKELGTEHDFDLDDYGDNLHLLLADVAEFLTVTGKFDSPAKLLQAIRKAS